MKQLSEMTVEELKTIGFDVMEHIAQEQNNLAIIRQEIGKRTKQPIVEMKKMVEEAEVVKDSK